MSLIGDIRTRLMENIYIKLKILMKVMAKKGYYSYKQISWPNLHFVEHFIAIPIIVKAKEDFARAALHSCFF